MRVTTLRDRMVLLVLAGVLPLLTYNLGTIYLDFRTERQRVETQALDLARALAHAVEAEVRTRIAALEVLALSRALQANDLRTFRQQAEAVLARQLPGSSILLVREDGQQVMNTALPEGAPLPLRQDLTDQQRVFATGRPSVSDLFYGLAVARPVVAIEVPVRSADGQVRQVLALNPTLDAFAAVIRRQKPEADWIVTVLDGAGRRVARVPGTDAMVGTQAPEEVLRLLDKPPNGAIEVHSAEGDRLVAALAPLEGIGWTVAVGSPLTRLTGPAWRHALTSFVVGMALLGVGLGLSRRIAHGIIDPIHGLPRLADRVDAGAPAPPSGLREVDEVAAALLREARQRRDALAAMQDSERRLRLVVAELNHRAKNALATVQALALQTARGEPDPARFNAAFSARLGSLARAHDLLTAFAWEGAALQAVIRAGLAPWLGTAEARISLDCHEAGTAPVLPGQAQALVLALHELATNAVKHGALSGAEGRVAVSCRRLEAGDGSLLLWRESGGPPVPGPPTRSGFGMRLLERALMRDLGPGSLVTLDFLPAGMQATIRIITRPVRPGAYALAE